MFVWTRQDTSRTSHGASDVDIFRGRMVTIRWVQITTLKMWQWVSIFTNSTTELNITKDPLQTGGHTGT